MPWERKTVEEQRREFAEAAKESKNFSALCREFGITRKTGYKWVERYKGNTDLSDKSRKPFTIANRTPAETEERIVVLRAENPGWGAKKLKEVLERQGYEIPCVKTVNNILNRYGCISAEESRKHQTFTRFEKEHCNEMWQTDFKGEFRMADNNMSLSNEYSILLSHRPEMFEEYVSEEVDLVLSGHAHGGQFRVPFIGGIIAPNQGLFPKFDAGKYIKNNTTMIVSRGIGNSIIPVRFNNRPEIVIVELIRD